MTSDCRQGSLTSMSILSRVSRMIPSIFRSSCWSCYRSIPWGKGVDGYSPFGAPFSGTWCQECEKHRASDEHHVVWHLRRWTIGAFPPDPAAMAQEIEWSPEVHVFSDGEYVLLRDWIGSSAHRRSIERYVDHPEHRELKLDARGRHQDLPFLDAAA